MISIAQVLMGIASGVLLAGAGSGFFRAQQWPQTSRAIIASAFLLILIAQFIEIFRPPSGHISRVALVALVSVGAGLAYLRYRDISPVTPFATGLLLVYATLEYGGGPSVPRDIVFFTALAASAASLPAIEAATREWRGGIDVPRIAPLLWIGLSFSIGVTAITAWLDGGALFASSPGAAWLLAAWITSSGSLLMKRGRPRATCIAVAAVSIVFGALSL